jgi:hypothetical protein
MICYLRAYLKEKKQRIKCENELKETKRQLKERIRELEDVIETNKVMWERRSERAKLLTHLESLRRTTDSISVDCRRTK